MGDDRECQALHSPFTFQAVGRAPSCPGVYQDAGVNYLAGIMFGVNSVRSFLNQMEQFATHVMPAFKRRR